MTDFNSCDNSKLVTDMFVTDIDFRQIDSWIDSFLEDDYGTDFLTDSFVTDSEF